RDQGGRQGRRGAQQPRGAVPDAGALHRRDGRSEGRGEGGVPGEPGAQRRNQGEDGAVKVHRLMGAWVHGRITEPINPHGRMDLWTYGPMDLWTYGPMDPWTLRRAH